jgi:hypothetical protein
LVINLFLSDEGVDDDFAQLFVRMLLLIHIDMIHPAPSPNRPSSHVFATKSARRKTRTARW